MTNIVIASAARTAVGSFGGSFANTPAHDLGATMLSLNFERGAHLPTGLRKEAIRYGWEVASPDAYRGNAAGDLRGDVDVGGFHDPGAR